MSTAKGIPWRAQRAWFESRIFVLPRSRASTRPGFHSLGCLTRSRATRTHQSPIRFKAAPCCWWSAPGGISRPRKHLGTRLPPNGLPTDLWLTLAQRANPHVADSRGVLAHRLDRGGRHARPIRPGGSTAPNPIHGLGRGGRKLVCYANARASSNGWWIRMMW